jgi:hypothetical protein
VHLTMNKDKVTMIWIVYMASLVLLGGLQFPLTFRTPIFISSINLPGAARVRTLPAYEFCHQGFVLGKSSEAGFGNEMYKILTAAALSIMLNRSLIIGQTRHIYSATFIFIFCLNAIM